MYQPLSVEWIPWCLFLVINFWLEGRNLPLHLWWTEPESYKSLMHKRLRKQDSGFYSGKWLLRKGFSQRQRECLGRWKKYLRCQRYQRHETIAIEFLEYLQANVWETVYTTDWDSITWTCQALSHLLPLSSHQPLDSVASNKRGSSGIRISPLGVHCSEIWASKCIHGWGLLDLQVSLKCHFLKETAQRPHP